MTGEVSPGTGVMICVGIFTITSRDYNTLEGTYVREILYRLVEPMLTQELVDEPIHQFNNINFKNHK